MAENNLQNQPFDYAQVASSEVAFQQVQGAPSMPRGERQNSNEEPDYGEIFFNWKFSEFPQHQRSRSWYIWGGIAVGLLLIYSIFTFNFLFGLIVIMISLIVLLFHRSSNEVTFQIAEDGIIVNGKFYSFKSLKNFFIIYEPPEIKNLYFEPKNI